MREDMREDGRPAPWRGQVVTVPGGERVYARSPDELPVLLAHEISRAGIRLGWTWRLRLALHHWRRAFRRRG